MSDWLKELQDGDRLEAIKTAFGRVATTQDGEVMLTVIAEAGKILEPIFDEEDRIRHNFALELFQLLPNALTVAKQSLVRRRPNE